MGRNFERIVRRSSVIILIRLNLKEELDENDLNNFFGARL